MAVITIVVKAVHAVSCTGWARRSANESCLPATRLNTPHCHQGRSCQPLPIRGYTSIARAAFTGCYILTARSSVGIGQGHHRNPGPCQDSGWQEPIRCGVGTSLICLQPFAESGCTSIWWSMSGAVLVRRACLRELVSKTRKQPLILHAGNGNA